MARDRWMAHVHSEADRLPVYLIVSEAPLLLQEATDALRRSVLADAAAPDFNQTVFSGDEADPADIIEAARTLPMMAPRRWVHVRDVQRLSAQALQTLASYIASPAPTTVLCLSGTKIDKRTAAGRQWSKLPGYFELLPPKEQALPTWLVERAAQRGERLSEAAAECLVDRIGTNLEALEQALEKALCYAGKEGPVEPEHVQASTLPTRAQSVFRLTAAIGGRRLPEALLHLRRLLDQGESTLMILAMICRHLRQLLLVQWLEPQRLPAGDFAKQVGVPPFALNALRQQARGFSHKTLERVLQDSVRCELRLKTNARHGGAILEHFILCILPPSGK